MDKQNGYPILWVGPAGVGKLRAARELLGVNQNPHLRTLEIGDYAARYWEFPTHMEVDIMDLSMKDKEILPELLHQLLSTRDVTCGQRKLMILRRVHGLSPAAAIRVRACLEVLVWAAGAPAMIWCTARTVNSSVKVLMDLFVYRRVVGQEFPRRAELSTQLGVSGVPTIQTYTAEILRQMLIALEAGPPTLTAAEWIRGRVYELLGLMITGSDLVSSLTWATVRLAATGSLDTVRAKAVLDILSRTRWVPSYRTPLMLELILTKIYTALYIAP